MTDATHAELEPLDLTLGPFEVQVHERLYPDSQDDWECNLLSVSAKCSVLGVRLSFTGGVLDAESFLTFLRDLEKVYATASGDATLDAMDSKVSLVVSASDPIGHLKCRVEITDYHSHGHWFEFDSDLSYLPPVLAQCRRIVDRNPIRNPAVRGV